MTLLLSNEDVERALPMRECLEAMEIAYRDLGLKEGANGLRSEVLTPTARGGALYSLLTMSGVVPRFKIAAVRIDSDILTWPSLGGVARRVKVPAADGRYVGLVLLFDTHTGEPLAIYPDGVVQRMRVGAVTGLAAKYLARAEAQEVALIGAGFQAGAQAMAIAAVRNVKRIRCFSPDRQKRESFAREIESKLGLEVVPCDSAREAVKGVDIVLCATNSMEPALMADWLEAGQHVSSISRLELDPDIIAKANVIFLHVHEVHGKSIRTAGAYPPKDVEDKRAALGAKIAQAGWPELPDLLLDKVPGRGSDRDITLFLNYTGLGYQFAATGHVIYKNAREAGLGRELDTSLFTSALPS
ncbi:MAG TPA: ornithine cyclodeaminase family protein [Micropepsaceae bacterium]|nr:ornithine cyclodeaminase family protein [Micropepsaceae bacterium]